MNVYQKILVRLYEVTGGRDSKTVDFKELLKKEGFYPSYDDIFKQLSKDGYISDAGRSGMVRITHWGVKEARISQAGSDGTQRKTKKAAKRLKDEAKQFLIMSEELAGDITEENFRLVEDKFDMVKNAFEKLKSNF